MKKLGIILAGLVVVFVSHAAEEQRKKLSLQETIQIALEHNLDIKIERYNPIIEQFALSGTYGAYDPVLVADARHNFRASGGGFNSTTGFDIVPNETDNESFNGGLTGLLPTGLRYDIGADVNRSSGTGTDFDTNGVPFQFERGFQYDSFAGISLQQPLLKNFWIDASRLQIWTARKTLKISEEGFRQQLIDTVTQVEQAYYELIFAYENVKVQEAALELAARSLAENKKRVEVGAMAPLDEKQAESQEALSRANLIAAKSELEQRQNALKDLLTENYTAWHGVEIEPSESLVAAPPILDLQESWRKGMTMRPDLKQARLDLERRDITLKYQYNQLFPQLDLVGSYGRSGVSDRLGSSWDEIRREDLPSYSYGAVFTYPLGNRNSRYNYKATKASTEQALLGLKRLEQTAMVDIDDAVRFARSSYERVHASRQARLYAEAALDAEQKKLENGKSTSFEVLILQRDLTNRRSDEIRALADYNIALVQVSAREGSTLDRKQISLQVK